MAKTTSFSFKDISNALETISQKTSVQIEKKSNSQRVCIDTGIYILNACLAKSILTGGVANNRITFFAGKTGVGKSYLCYNICKYAQKSGYNIIYIDTEFAIELSDFEDYGVDTEKNFMLLRSNKVEDLKIMLTQLLDGLKQEKLKGTDIGKTIIFMDSVGQLASAKEVEDALEGKNKQDMTRAKAIKSLFRIINSDLGFLNIGLICTNHTYDTTDLFPQEKMSGGEGANYSASTIIFLSKAKLKTGEEDELDLQSGIVVTAQAKKNRMAKPKKVKFEINFGSGTNRYKGLEFFCTPENFEKIGIAKGKQEVNKKTGEITFVPGGTKWYVRHLDKSFYEKQIFNKNVFTDEILAALDPIITDYFSYGTDEDVDAEPVMGEEFNEDSEFNIDTDDNLFK